MENNKHNRRPPAEFTGREWSQFRPMQSTRAQNAKCREAQFRTAHNRFRWRGVDLCRGQMYGIFEGIPRIISGQTAIIAGRKFFEVRTRVATLEVEEFRTEWIAADSTFGQAISASMQFNPYGHEMPKDKTDCTGSKPELCVFSDKRPERKPKAANSGNTRTYIDEMLIAYGKSQGAATK